MRRGWVATLTVVALLVAGGSVAAAGIIREIVVVDNSKTTDDTIRYLAGIEEGDEWDDDVREKVRIELVSSGLFKQVDFMAEPHPRGGIRVTISAIDKHSWIVAPTFYNQPTNKGAGLGFGENNLLGENKKLLLYGQAATGDSFLIAAYVDPSIAETRFSWQVDTFLRYERVIEYEVPLELESNTRPVRESKLMYLNGGIRAGMTLFRSLTLEQRLRGAKVAYYRAALLEGMSEADVGVEPGQPIPEPGTEGWDVSTETSLTYDRRANWFGITKGTKVRLAFEPAITPLSDFDYWYATLGFERAFRLFRRHNFILRGMAGYGDDMPFQQEYSSGGPSLRGYENRQFRGDTKAAASAEYSIHLFTAKGVAIRGLLFGDTSYTTFLDRLEDNTFRRYLPHHGRRGLGGFKNAAGGGIRLHVRQLVLPLLGLDVGYGIETGGIELYLAIGLNDF